MTKLSCQLQSFAREVYNMRVNHSLFDEVPANFKASKHSFGRTLVKRSDSISGDQRSANGLLVRDRSLRSFSSDNDRISSIDDTLGLLSNVRYGTGLPPRERSSGPYPAGQS